MGKTKKVKQVGRFGSRYGVGIRKRMLKIEPLQRKRHVCPNCGFERVKRISTGIFECSKCELVFAGGSYLPKTMSGSIIAKMVQQKAFLPFMAQLIETKEGTAEEGKEIIEGEGKELKAEKQEARHAEPKPIIARKQSEKPVITKDEKKKQWKEKVKEKKATEKVKKPKEKSGILKKALKRFKKEKK